MLFLNRQRRKERKIEGGTGRLVASKLDLKLNIVVEEVELLD